MGYPRETQDALRKYEQTFRWTIQRLILKQTFERPFSVYRVLGMKSGMYDLKLMYQGTTRVQPRE